MFYFAILFDLYLMYINGKSPIDCTDFEICAVDRAVFLLIQVRIRDSCVVNRLQPVDKHHLGEVDVTERDGAFLEEPIAHLRVDELVYQPCDAFLGIFLQ